MKLQRRLNVLNNDKEGVEFPTRMSVSFYQFDKEIMELLDANFGLNNRNEELVHYCVGTGVYELKLQKFERIGNRFMRMHQYYDLDPKQDLVLQFREIGQLLQQLDQDIYEAAESMRKKEL